MSIHERLIKNATRHLIIKEDNIDATIHSLEHSVHTCTESGITNELYDGKRVIVSLTSIKPKLKTIHTTIETLLHQSMKPNKIILWLGDNLKNEELSAELRSQMKRGLEIRFRKDVGPITKCWYALQEMPDDYIFVCDDDMFFQPDQLEKLYKSCIHDKCIVGYWSKNYTKNFLGLKPVDTTSNTAMLEHFMTVMYPPHVFDEETFNESILLKYALRNDDIYLYIQELRQKLHVKCILENDNFEGLYHYRCMNFNVQQYGLSSNENKNRYIGWGIPYNNLYDYYHLEEIYGERNHHPCQFNIVYRVNDENDGIHGAREVFDGTKLTTIKHCFNSLMTDIRKTPEIEFNVHLIYDNISDELMRIIERENIVKTYTKCDVAGGIESFKKQVEIAKNLTGFVLFLEDDYFILPGSLRNLYNDMKYFTTRYENTVINPAEDLNPNYKSDIELSNLTRIGDMDFRKVEHSTCTFCTTADVIRKYYDTLMKYNNTEYETVNKMVSECKSYAPFNSTLFEHMHSKSTLSTNSFFKF